MKHLDEKIIALRNEMREQMNHESALAEKASAEKGQEIQAIDLYQTFIDIEGKPIQVIDQSIMEGKITFRMPRLFSIMDLELASLKYPSERRPNLIYTDESTTINLAFNAIQYELSDEEVEDFRDDMAEVLEQAQPSAQWMEKEMTVINDRTIGFIEVITPALDGNIYNLMFFSALDGQALIGTFNCMEDDMETWRPIARSMMETLQFASGGVGGGNQA